MPSFTQSAPGTRSPLPLPNSYEAAFQANLVRIREAVAPVSNEADFDTAGYIRVTQSTDYLDGLGRLLQTVNRQAAPGGKPNDVVIPVLYDQWGQQPVKYLPYVARSGQQNNGSFKRNPFVDQQNFFGKVYKDVNGQDGYGGEKFYYSETQTEASPMARTINSMAQGNSWVGSNRGVVQEYHVNQAADLVVRWNIGYEPLGNGKEDEVNKPFVMAGDTFYTRGSLYKNVVRDEQGKVTVEYRNQRGQVLLRKVQSGEVAKDLGGYEGWLSTYYVYDDFDQLRFVMPPKAVEWLVGHAWSLEGAEGSAMIRELCFRYEYDARQRMFAKKVPGAGWVYMVYDVRNRVALTQDAGLRAKNRWQASQYDDYNRLTGTGMLECALGFQEVQEAMQNTVADVTMVPELKSYTYYPLVKTHFDHYRDGDETFTDQFNAVLDAGANPYPDMLPSRAAQTGVAVKGLITGVDVAIIEDPAQPGTNGWLSSYPFYDAKGRVIQTRRHGYKGSKETITSRFDFSGNLIASYVVHNNPQATGKDLRLKTNYDYDQKGRLLGVFKTVNDQPSTRTLIEKDTYDEMGYLQRRELGRKRVDAQSHDGSQPLEQLDYTYNIRGWLKGINAAYSHPELQAGTGTSHWFGMELGYDGGSSDKNKNQYNGNLSWSSWRSRGNAVQRAYGFSYDVAGRLTGADFSERQGDAFTDNPAVSFDVQMGSGSGAAYDANGNILGMTQWGMKPGGSSPVDRLVYRYFENSNKLRSVDEDATTAADNRLGDFTDNNKGDDYGYDVNGNMTADLNKYLNGSLGLDQQHDAAIVYNHLNLPWKIAVAPSKDGLQQGGVITYVYDAQGNKLEKRVMENGSVAKGTKDKETVTTYMGSFVYEQVNQDPVKLLFASHEQGRLRISGKGEQVNVNYDYFIKDHLGNVRVVLTDELEVDPYTTLSFDGTSQELAVQKATWDDRDAQPLEVHSARADRPQNFGDSAANGRYVMLVRKKTGATGAAKLLKVMAGDRIHTSVEYYYTAPHADNGKADALSTLLVNLASILPISGQVAGSLKDQGSAITGALQSDAGLPMLLNDPVQKEGTQEAPKAYLNVLLFDEQFRIDKVHSQVIPVAYQPDTKGIIDRRLANAVDVTGNGYAYVYFSNESNEMVYFDNFTLSHERGPLLEETHYYPFGLTMAGISSKAFGGMANKRGFNGGNELQNKEFSDGSGLEMYDAVHRMYDPQLGRFWQIDEFGEANTEWSPYVFGNNNPMLFNDPIGLLSTKDNPEELQAVVVKGMHSEAALENTYWYLRNNGLPFNSAPKNIRNWLYGHDRVQRYIEKVHDGTRTQGIIVANVASFFIPVGEIAQLARLSKLIGLLRLRRGVQGASGLLGGFGTDAAIVNNMANLIPKRGWYDVVVHGTEDGLNFVIDGTKVTAEQLYTKMIEEGYTQGSKVRLLSCYSGAVEGGAASQLANFTKSAIVAPKSWITVADGTGFLERGQFMIGEGKGFQLFK